MCDHETKVCPACGGENSTLALELGWGLCSVCEDHCFSGYSPMERANAAAAIAAHERSPRSRWEKLARAVHDGYVQVREACNPPVRALPA